ncbi:MAG TPA: prepilin-type N-terminal cleavage/methylation domain-containing protein, partial [Candidatus Saccharimonadales bacterium]|nr:prepilin-type N-terminal cleavage/methylation domain-containing protein [Candidatus Saccharimonadales bacterium]
MTKKNNPLKIQKLTSGFTIIELLVVIVIIAILAVLTIVTYIGVQANARDTSVQSDIDAMDSIQTNYGLKNGVAGKAYYSGNGYDSALGFTPSGGDVIDVVVNSTDYCIRGY